jgi:hypothetical protein
MARAETFIDKKGRVHHRGKWVHVVHVTAKRSADGRISYMSGARRGDRRIRWVVKPTIYRSHEDGKPCDVYEIGYWENLERNPYEEE